MKFLYHSIVHAVLLAIAPFVLVRCGWDQKFRKNFFSRLHYRKDIHSHIGSIWIHASSVGEVRAAFILWNALKQTGHRLILSTFTATGYDLAKKENMEPVFRLPPDSLFCIRPLVKKLQPVALVLIEAEFWPTLLWECQRKNVPVILVNGRMSQKSIGRYSKFSSFFQSITKAIELFCMRSKHDAERIKRLGIDPRKIRVTGNIKFDAFIPKKIGTNEPSEKAPLIVFGSTRPGDEGHILDAIRRLKETLPDLRCVLAPRHIQRSQEVENLIRDFGLNFVKHSEISERENQNHSLILVDTLGDLNCYYQKSYIAFVGGGFNSRFGGHNILEPAFYGQPVIYGKHMENFEEEASLLKQSAGGIQIESPQSLYPTLQRLLNNPKERNDRGLSAAQTILANRGAIRKNLELITSLIS